MLDSCSHLSCLVCTHSANTDIKEVGHQYRIFIGALITFHACSPTTLVGLLAVLFFD